jgi:hypothetical protein
VGVQFAVQGPAADVAAGSLLANLNFPDNTRFLVTIIGGDIGGGFTEQYLTAVTTTTSDLARKINDLMIARQGVSGTDISFTEVRVSQYGTKRQSQVCLPFETRLWNSTSQVKFNTTGTYAAGGFSGRTNQLRVCAQWRITFGANRTTTRYLAAPPIGISAIEPNNFNVQNNTSWFNAFTNFGNTLVSAQWAILGSNVGSAGTLYGVGGVVTGPAPMGLLGVVIKPTPAIPALTMGDRVIITGMKPAKGSRGPTINGGWSVFSTDTTTVVGYTTVYLQGSTGIAPAIMRTTAKSALRIPTPVPYQILSVDLKKNGIRKRGKVATQYRGRVLHRVTLDP